MKFRFATCVVMAAGLGALLAGCGGGGGGASTTPIPVTAAKNPVLVGSSTTITASFAAYTSAVKFGSTVNFSVTAPATISSATTTTKAGGIASITVTSNQAGTYTVSASSGSFAGSTAVSFIPQPAAVNLMITSKQAISKLAGLSFDVLSDTPVTFNGYSTLKASGILSITNPNVTPAFNISKITAGLTSLPGIDVTSTSTLFLLKYATPAAGVPIFTIDQASVTAGFANLSSVKPTPTLVVSPVYYDSTGKVLYP
ncbi:hypothetical protein F6V25_12805 [Oryzomonas japonica]|uniref:Big-1 domain-containing protein n=1 Tax=Oryzomonas japonica TaxID=2603858 RepID=A0A7J4ZP01_9BACT|nr:hypothetical protein [Oryzomonas japonica]KAB0664415.1 hypothetical protein F6V25_12805 [Oryzomonas japonica]